MIIELCIAYVNSRIAMEHNLQYNNSIDNIDCRTAHRLITSNYFQCKYKFLILMSRKLNYINFLTDMINAMDNINNTI